MVRLVELHKVEQKLLRICEKNAIEMNKIGKDIPNEKRFYKPLYSLEKVIKIKCDGRTHRRKDGRTD